jgi:hypothetical protein
MSAPLKVYRKSVVERRRLYFDYSCWLEEDEELTSFQITVTPYTSGSPITATGGYTDATNKKFGLFVGAGLANTSYTLQMVVQTDAGQVKRDDIGVMVTP